MKYHQLTASNVGSRKRVGRGIGSGHGKTAGRGTKGQNSRSGGGVRPGFEGGQTPLSQRLPKQKGFHSLRPTTQIIHTDQLNQFKDGTEVSINELKQVGLVSSTATPVKLLLRGKVSKKLDVKLQAASIKAAADVKDAGGQFKTVGLPKRVTRSKASSRAPR